MPVRVSTRSVSGNQELGSRSVDLRTYLLLTRRGHVGPWATSLRESEGAAGFSPSLQKKYSVQVDGQISPVGSHLGYRRKRRNVSAASSAAQEREMGDSVFYIVSIARVPVVALSCNGKQGGEAKEASVPPQETSANLNP